MVNLALMVSKDQRGNMDLLELKVFQDLQVLQELVVVMVKLAEMVCLVQRVHKVKTATLEKLVMMVRKDTQVRVLQENQEPLDYLVHLAHQVNLGPLGML